MIVRTFALTFVRGLEPDYEEAAKQGLAIRWPLGSNVAMWINHTYLGPVPSQIPGFLNNSPE